MSYERRSSGRRTALQDRNRRAPAATEHQRRACYAPPSEDPRLWKPSDPRNPFFGLVERVLALASAAVAFPLRLAISRPSRRRPQSRRPWSRNSSQRSPLRWTARGPGCSRELTSKPVLKKKLDAGPPPPHLTPGQVRRQAGERLDAELDALEGALAAAEAAIACARAHGDALRVHVGCAPHEDAVCTRVRTQPRPRRSANLRRMNSRAGRGIGSRRAAEPPRRRVARAGAAGAGDVRRGRAAVENRRRRLGEVGAGRRRGAAARGGRPAQPRRVVCRTFWRARVARRRARRGLLCGNQPVSWILYAHRAEGDVDGLNTPRHRADAATKTTSRQALKFDFHTGAPFGSVWWTCWTAS